MKKGTRSRAAISRLETGHRKNLNDTHNRRIGTLETGYTIGAETPIEGVAEECITQLKPVSAMP